MKQLWRRFHCRHPVPEFDETYPAGNHVLLLVSGIRVEARGALVAGQTVMMPWVGAFSDYRRQNGMMIPFRGEVAWITPQGERPYFRGTVTQVGYRFAK
jgi:hypothetical protein